MTGFELIPKIELGSAAEETTLVSDSQPACLAACDIPVTYLSIRITVSHVDVVRLLESCFSGIDYICYKHTGKKTKKEHIHVLVWDMSSDNKIRKRLAKLGYKGNETFSVKGFKNGLLSGVQYCAKEGTVPIQSGDFDHWINSAPKWEQRRVESYCDRKPIVDRDWQLTYSNLVCQAVRYAQDNNLTEHSLKHVVRDMMLKTKFRPCHQMYKQGVPPCYEEDFKVRVGRERTYEMDWWNNYQKYS